jgi:threonine dehydratase
MVTLQDIEAARARIAGHVQHSPMPRSDALSELCRCDLYVKLENLQRTGSFKERGALNKLLSLSDEEKKRGVISASAGNHAQGVAFHATRLGIPSTIVMPELSPLVKVRSTRDFGAEVILHGDSFDDAYAHARALEAERHLVFVHPFDDNAVIAGQGTLGLEILADLPDVDAVIVAIGGGGLIGGASCAIKSLKPSTQIIGVNASVIAGMEQSLAARKVMTMPAARTIADGIAVRRVGDRTFAMAQKYVDRVVSVDDEEVANAILQLLEKEKTVAEGAGAAPMAALLHRDLGLEGKKVVVVVGGGNINVNLISRIIERGLIKDGRRVGIKVVVPDRPGMLAQVLAEIARLHANVLEVRHQRWSRKLSLGDTEVSLVIETRGPEHIAEIEGALARDGLTVMRQDD